MRNDILERRSDIEYWVSTNQSKAYMCRQLNCKIDTLNRYLVKLDIIYFGNQSGKGNKSPKRKTAIEYINSGSDVRSDRLRIKLIEDGIKEHQCEECGLVWWMGERVSLELHHIDGNTYNNNLDNLQLLCPNCHAQTKNYCSKNIKTSA